MPDEDTPSIPDWLTEQGDPTTIQAITDALPFGVVGEEGHPSTDPPELTPPEEARIAVPQAPGEPAPAAPAAPAAPDTRAGADEGLF